GGAREGARGPRRGRTPRKEVEGGRAPSPPGGMGSLLLFLKDPKGLETPVPPVAKDSSCRRARMVVLGAKHAAQQLLVYHVVVLVDPQGFHEVVLVAGVILVERLHPFFEGGDDLPGVAAAQLDLRAVPDAIFRLLQEVEQLFDRLSGDPG